MEYQKNYGIYQLVSKNPNINKKLQEIQKRLQWQYRVYSVSVDINSISGSDSSRAYARAENIRSRLEKGINPAREARQVSDNAGASRNGGDLGYVSALEMPGGFFEDYVVSAPLNVFSKPIKSNNAYHIIKVTDKRKTVDSVDVTYLVFAKGLKKNYNDSIKHAVENIQNSLKTGADIETIRKNYSDCSPKNKTFYLKDAAEMFGSEIFNLKENDISKPIETDLCWYIVKLNKNILRVDNILTDDMRQKFFTDERFTQYLNQFNDSIKKVAGYKKTGSYELLYPYFKDSAIFEGKWQTNGAEGITDNLFRINGENYTVSDFVDYIYKNQKPCPATKAAIYLRKTYNSFVDSKLQAQSHNILYKGNSYYRYLIDSVSTDILYNLADKKENFSVKASDEKNIEKYYNSNAEKYSSGYKLSLEIYKAINPSNVKKNVKAINKYSQTGQPDLLIGLFENKGYGYFPHGKNKIADQITDGFNTQKYSLPNDEVISYNGGEYFVLPKILEKPQPKPLKDIYPQVQNDYLQQLKTDYQNGLQKKYNIEINKTTLQEIKNYFINK